MNVENCLRDLRALLEGPDKPGYESQLETDLVDGIYKGHHQIVNSKYSFDSAKQSFINAIMDNIRQR